MFYYNIDGCNGSDLGSGLDFVGFDQRSQFEDWLVREHKSDFASDQVLEGLEVLDGSSEFVQVLIIRMLSV